MSTTPRYDAALADELNVANPQELHRAHERTLLALAELERELANVTKALNAARKLIKSRDERDAHDVDRLRSLSGAIAETESERAANARLTEELAAAQQRIAELEQLSRMVGYAAEAHSNDADKWSAQLAAMRSERDAARRDADALRKDAGRYRMFRELMSTDEFMLCAYTTDPQGVLTGTELTKDDLDTAIDAAIAKEKP